MVGVVSSLWSLPHFPLAHPVRSLHFHVVWNESFTLIILPLLREMGGCFRPTGFPWPPPWVSWVHEKISCASPQALQGESLVPGHFHGLYLACKAQVLTELRFLNFPEMSKLPFPESWHRAQDMAFLRELGHLSLFLLLFDYLPSSAVMDSSPYQGRGPLILHLFSPSLYLYGTNFSLRAFQNIGFDTQKPRFWNIKALFTETVVSGNNFRTLL